MQAYHRMTREEADAWQQAVERWGQAKTNTHPHKRFAVDGVRLLREIERREPGCRPKVDQAIALTCDPLPSSLWPDEWLQAHR